MRQSRLLTASSTCLFGVLLLNGIVAASAGGAGKKEAEVLGVTLGESTIEDVLFILGSPETIYLVGSDGEGGARPGNGVVMVYDRDFCLEYCLPSRVSFVFGPGGYEAQLADVQFRGEPSGVFVTVPARVVKSRYGNGYRVVRHHLVSEQEGLEAELSRCHDPDGDFETWLYPAMGLQVYVEESQVSPRVRVLRYSLGILVGEDDYPPCQ